MKIGLVSCEYPPFRGGGVGTYAATASRILAEAGHEVHVITNRWKGFGDPESQSIPGLRVHRIDALTPSYGLRPLYRPADHPTGRLARLWETSLFWSTLVADELESVASAHELEVIEFPEVFAEAWVPLRRRDAGVRTLDLPMTVTLHTPTRDFVSLNRGSSRERWVRRRAAMEDDAIRRADLLCSPSLDLARRVVERLDLDGASHACEVLHNPVPLVERIASVPSGPPFLLFVGRLESRKGVGAVVEAACRVLPGRSDLVLRLLGRDVELPGGISAAAELRARVPEALRPRILFEGLRPREEVLARYGQATLVVLPAEWDNFPYTCVEAMARGACVVAGRRGGAAEMIEDGRSGWLVDSGDVDGLTALVERLLENPDLIESTRRRAPERIAALCGPEVWLARRLTLYREAAARHAKRAPGTPATRSVEVSLSISRESWEETDGPGALRPDGVPASVRAAAERAGVRPGAADSPSVLVLSEGDELDPRFLELVLEVLSREPEAAWATTWVDSVPGSDPLVGSDFELPDDLLWTRPLPIALFRRSALDEIGGFRDDLPPELRAWEAAIALRRRGWRGLVVPILAGSSIPRDGLARLSLTERTRILERVAERTLSGDAVDLWIDRELSHLPPPPTTRRPAARARRLLFRARRRLARLLGR